MTNEKELNYAKPGEVLNQDLGLGDVVSHRVFTGDVVATIVAVGRRPGVSTIIEMVVAKNSLGERRYFDRWTPGSVGFSGGSDLNIYEYTKQINPDLEWSI